MSRSKLRTRTGLSSSAWAGIAIILLIIGLVAGYFAGSSMAKPATLTKTVTVTQTQAGGATTVTKTVTTTVSGAPTKAEYTFYFISHGGPGDPW